MSDSTPQEPTDAQKALAASLAGDVPVDEKRKIVEGEFAGGPGVRGLLAGQSIGAALAGRNGATPLADLPAGTVIVKPPGYDVAVMLAILCDMGETAEVRELKRLGTLLHIRLEREDRERRAEAALNDEVRALAETSSARSVVTADTSLASTADCPLEESNDPKRWAEAYGTALGSTSTDDQAGIGVEYFRKAMAAAALFADRRATEQFDAVLETLRGQLGILELWAVKMQVPGGEHGLPLHADPDARRWVAEFLATVDDIERKEGHRICDPLTFNRDWLLSWFANAMCASHDWALELVRRQMAGKVLVPKEKIERPVCSRCSVELAQVRLPDGGYACASCITPEELQETQEDAAALEELRGLSDSAATNERPEPDIAGSINDTRDSANC